jgi:hypothetical protein
MLYLLLLHYLSHSQLSSVSKRSMGKVWIQSRHIQGEPSSNNTSRSPLLISICGRTKTVEQGKSTGLLQHYVH